MTVVSKKCVPRATIRPTSHVRPARTARRGGPISSPVGVSLHTTAGRARRLACARLRPDPPPPPWASRSLFPPSVGSATRRDEVRSKSTRARTLGPLARRAPPLDLLWTAFLSLRSAKTAEHNVNTATRAANTATRAIDAADERHSSRRNDTLSQLAADGGDVVQPVSPANFWFA